MLLCNIKLAECSKSWSGVKFSLLFTRVRIDHRDGHKMYFKRVEVPAANDKLE